MLYLLQYKFPLDFCYGILKLFAKCSVEHLFIPYIQGSWSCMPSVQLNVCSCRGSCVMKMRPSISTPTCSSCARLKISGNITNSLIGAKSSELLPLRAITWTLMLMWVFDLIIVATKIQWVNSWAHNKQVPLMTSHWGNCT